MDLNKLNNLIYGDAEVARNKKRFGISPIRMIYKTMKKFLQDCHLYGIDTKDKTFTQLKAELKAAKGEK